MPITFVKGDLLKSSATALVNTVNCIGVAGAGIAKTFKEQYPVNFDVYKTHCNLGYMQPGKLLCTSDPTTDKVIVNFPTKVDWRHPSKVEYIEAGLDALHDMLSNQSISIAIPPLGCGLGGLDWKTQIGPLVISKLKNLDTSIELYAPPINIETRQLKVLVTGGRDYSDYNALFESLNALQPTHIIHGAARGADTLANTWAKENNVEVSQYPAQWDKYGKAAGFIRNKEMLENGNPDYVLACPGGNGTEHMKTTAHSQGYRVLLIQENGPPTYDTRSHNMRTTQNDCPQGFVRADRKTKWGNYSATLLNENNRVEVVTDYENYLREAITNGKLDTMQIASLAGRTLACWCSPALCHTHILGRYADYYAAHYGWQAVADAAKANSI